MSAITIKVTTEELLSKADIVKTKVAQMQRDIDEAERLLTGWETREIRREEIFKRESSRQIRS